MLPGFGPGEVAVIGLGRSGRAAAELLRFHGHAVYASDGGAPDAVRHAAKRLVEVGCVVDTGGHDLARIARAVAVVASPGVPPEAPPLAAARAAGVPILSEIETALRALPDLRYVATTGTNGKTTVTALVGHLLRALKHDAPEAGNIGLPLAEVALRPVAPTWASLEVSSFQLHDTPGIAPACGVVTTLSPDHLDRYPTIEAYYADKANLFANATSESRWVLNGDVPEVLALHRRLPDGHPVRETLPGFVHRFSLHDPAADAWYDRAAGQLMLFGAPLLPRGALPLVGDHNVANALTAALAVSVADFSHRGPEARRAIADALAMFRALPHRLEVVAMRDGVTWINDSKATNVGSTLVAVQGMDRPAVVLLGGRHKGEPYTPLLPALRTAARAVLAYGEAAPLIEQDLAGHVPFERLGSSFDEVIARARALAQPGDAILLSPACSSYDMFANYEDRGDTFRRLASA